MSYRRGHETGHRSQQPHPLPAFAQEAYAEQIRILEEKEAEWQLEQQVRAEEEAAWHASVDTPKGDPTVNHEQTLALAELDGAINQYRLTYTQHQSAKTALEAARAEAQTIYATEAEQEQAWRILCGEMESELRAAILAAYQATGNTKPAPGVGIRETTTYQYDPAAALAWCLEHKVALQLDTKAFEALCKHPSTRPDFVHVVKTPTATIGAALKGE